MGLSVNGDEIAEAAICAELARLRPEYEAYVRGNGGEPDEAQLREWAEEDLIEEALFLLEAVATQPVPSDERARQFLDAEPDAFSGLSQEERLARGKEVLQRRRLMKELRKGVRQPDDAQIQAFYDAHPELFTVPETLRLSHLCRAVKPGDKAATFLELLRIKTEIDRSGLDWGDALDLFSESFEQDHGFFDPVSRGDLPPELEAKLFALKPGEVSDVCELGGRTLHLFKLLAKEPPQKLGVTDVRERVSELLFEEACREALEVRFDALKAAAVIRREA